MSQEASGAQEMREAPETGGDAASSASALEDRSPRLAERASEPGFFEQIVQLLKPRHAAPLRERLVSALEKVDDTGGGFSPGEQRMLTNLLGMSDLRVHDAMVARSEIEGLEISASLGQALRRFEETGHSRMPVYDDGLDDLKGMIHIRDALGHVTRAALVAGEGGVPRLDLSAVDLSPSVGELGLVRKVLFVPPSMPAAELMARMQATRIQMALVIDEYGGTDGLVSLEDLIEIIVGDIEDEHDTDEGLVLEEAPDVYILDARAELVDIRRLVGEDFDTSPYEEQSDTIGGLIVSELGRIPVNGEAVDSVPGFRFEVLEADGRRVRRVRMIRVAAGEVSTPLS